MVFHHVIHHFCRAKSRALGDSAQVWLRRDDFGLSPLRGTVLRRWPGQAEVLLEEPGFGSTDGLKYGWYIYITHIWFIWVYMGLYGWYIYPLVMSK